MLPASINDAVAWFVTTHPLAATVVLGYGALVIWLVAWLRHEERKESLR